MSTRRKPARRKGAQKPNQQGEVKNNPNYSKDSINSDNDSSCQHNQLD